MYLIERSLRTLKQYVRNKTHSEGSIVDAYVINESRTFCSRYLSRIETRFSRDKQNDDSILKDEVVSESEVFMQKVRPLDVTSSQSLSLEEKCQTHWYILNNIDEIAEYRKYVLSTLYTSLSL